MKKVIVLVVLALVVWLGVNYARTGRLSLMPGHRKTRRSSASTISKAELKSVESQIDQAGAPPGRPGGHHGATWARLWRARTSS